MSATATDIDRGVFYQRSSEPQLSLALASLSTMKVPGSRPALLAPYPLILFVRMLKVSSITVLVFLQCDPKRYR